MKRPLSQLLLCSLLGVVTNLVVAADRWEPSLKDVAGDYFYGDGMGVNCSLTLKSQGTFTFEWHGCLGTYDKNDGKVVIENGLIHLVPRNPNVREGFRGTATEFFPVRWGARIYLIPTNEIVEFCSDVNQGTEPRRAIHGEYYIRRNDEKKRASGRPDVPEPWKKYFLAKPVRGRITDVISKHEAWLNKGTADGLLPGMVLTAREHRKAMFSQVRIEAVEKIRCRIKCDWTDCELAVGQIVSSRFHD